MKNEAYNDLKTITKPIPIGKLDIIKINKEGEIIAGRENIMKEIEL